MKRENGSIRIGYLVSDYPAFSVTFITREIKALRERGFRIETASINSPTIHFEEEEEKRTFYIKEKGILGAAKSLCKRLITSPKRLFSSLLLAVSLGIKQRFFYHLFYFAEALILADWIERRSIDHLHVHFINPASTVALLVKGLTNVELSFTTHGPDCFRDPSKHFFAEKVSAAKFFVCISDFTKSQLMSLVPYKDWEKLHVVRLGIDTDRYKPPQEKERGERVELLSVGRLTGAKGQHLVLRAIERIKSEGFSLHATFVGGGPDYESLMEERKKLSLEKETTFTGPLSEGETKKLIERADIFLLPSFAEGLPVALMEAMATGVPCISSYIAGIPELISDRVEGRLVYAGNIDEITAALRELLSDPSLRKRYGKCGREKVVKNYSIAVNIEGLAKLFRGEEELWITKR